MTRTQTTNAKETTMENFETAIQTWMHGAQEIIRKHWAAQGYDKSMPEFMPRLSQETGKRYVRIVASAAGQRQAHAFIDMTNGDVLKPASWKAPAKHARGNIFDAANGLARTGEYGPNYLTR